VTHLLWGFVEQDIGIFGHGMFSAPHSVTRAFPFIPARRLIKARALSSAVRAADS
jgi:hypothetical protein